MTRDEMKDLIRQFPRQFSAPGLEETIAIAQLKMDLDPEEELKLRSIMVSLRASRRELLELRLGDLIGDATARVVVADLTDDEIRHVTTLADGELRRAVAERMVGRRADSANVAEAARASRVAVELLSSVADDVRHLTSEVRESAAVASAALGRLTDTTHVSVAEAARLKKVTPKTIRNWIAKRVLTLETVPGTRRSGIPVEQLSSGWLRRDQADSLRRRS